jgi:hypothetical protein
MQALARAREKPPAQEQWLTMEKQCGEQWKQPEIGGACLRPVATA